VEQAVNSAKKLAAVQGLGPNITRFGTWSIGHLCHHPGLIQTFKFDSNFPTN